MVQVKSENGTLKPWTENIVSKRCVKCGLEAFVRFPQQGSESEHGVEVRQVQTHLCTEICFS